MTPTSPDPLDEILENGYIKSIIYRTREDAKRFQGEITLYLSDHAKQHLTAWKDQAVRDALLELELPEKRDSNPKSNFKSGAESGFNLALEQVKALIQQKVGKHE